MMLGNARQATVRYKSMLMSVVGLLASAAIGFPLNPSFTPEAVKEYKARADAGDAEAQYLYSAALADGIGGVKDLPQAFVYAKKAASQGYERALGFIGRGYEEGWDNELDAVKAAECFSRLVVWAVKAAEEGDVDAQLSLGECYYVGKGVEPNMVVAVKWFRKAAEQGYAIAQYWLGWCYDAGKGVETNKVEAVKWYRKAAEGGWPLAQVDLGMKYLNGIGVEQDGVEAIKLFRKAAEQEYVCAQYALGSCYMYGKGVETNKVEAVKWYRRAAERGWPSAQVDLGVSYVNGTGVEQDLVEAVKWFRKAAEQEDAVAQALLGVSYENGKGVETNKAEAVKWYRKAAEQGHGGAQKRIDEMQAAEIRTSEIFQIVRADPNPATASHVSWKLRLLSDRPISSAVQVRNKLMLIREPEDKVSGKIVSVTPLTGGEKGFLVAVDDVCGEGKIGLRYDGMPPVFYEVKVRRPWLVSVTSCRAAMKGRYDSRVFITGVERGLTEGELISPSLGKCGYRVLSISDRCVWFEAFNGDKPPEDKLPHVAWPDFSRIDTLPPAPPPGRLMLGKRVFWPGDAIKLPTSGCYLVVDDFLDGKAVVFRLLDSMMMPVRDLLCVIVREEK